MFIECVAGWLFIATSHNASGAHSDAHRLSVSCFETHEECAAAIERAGIRKGVNVFGGEWEREVNRVDAFCVYLGETSDEVN
jgi:hypothetical protein